MDFSLPLVSQKAVLYMRLLHQGLKLQKKNYSKSQLFIWI